MARLIDKVYYFITVFEKLDILQHLQEHGSITSMDAYSLFGCTRLSARIKNLRDAGHHIVTLNETAKNREGNSVTYARYVLKNP